MHLPNWPYIRRLFIVIFFTLFIIWFLTSIRNALYLNHLSEILKREMLKLEFSIEDIMDGNSTQMNLEVVMSNVVPSNYHNYPEDTSQLSNPARTAPNRVPVFKSTPLKLGVIFTTIAFSSRHSSDGSKVERGLYSRVHYNNTLGMMGRLRPKMSPLVFVDDQAAIDLARKTENIILPIPKKNLFGMPLLNRMFIKVMEDYSAFFYCYTNGDILFPKSDLLKHLEILRGVIEKGLLGEKVLIIGRRTNVEYKTTAIVYTDGEIYDLAGRGELHSPDAQDYIIVTRDAFDWHIVPDFVVGRTAYDNWLVDFAYHRDFSIVDLTQTLVAVHQTGPDGIKASHSSARGLDKKWNYSLAKGKVDHGTVDFAQYISSFRDSRRGVRFWTLTHKDNPKFYHEVEYGTSV